MVKYDREATQVTMNRERNVSMLATTESYETYDLPNAQDVQENPEETLAKYLLLALLGQDFEVYNHHSLRIACTRSGVVTG
jgi:hypothetical protein